MIILPHRIKIKEISAVHRTLMLRCASAMAWNARVYGLVVQPAPIRAAMEADFRRESV